MIDCFDCEGNGQYGIARDGQPLVCPTCRGSGTAPAPTAAVDLTAAERWDVYDLGRPTHLRLL